MKLNSVAKGNALEVDFFNYLCNQKAEGQLVYGAYPSELCNIVRKKKYYCNERQADVEFDIVIELTRLAAVQPHLFIVFECKNHEGSIPEVSITDFSDKIRRIFNHAAKAVFVSSTRLQSGAERIAKSRRIGIVKFAISGVEIIAERVGSTFVERDFGRKQIFEEEIYVKPLKFSAFYDGHFYSSVGKFLQDLSPGVDFDLKDKREDTIEAVPFISVQEIQDIAQTELVKAGYLGGAVDLKRICEDIFVSLILETEAAIDSEGAAILGSANFDRKSIHINQHENKQRMRFTIAHEIGHFVLRHDRFLRSECVIERDLFSGGVGIGYNFDRIEHQANLLASELLLPNRNFLSELDIHRNHLGIFDRGHGYIFVDDQPVNMLDFRQLILALSSYFDVSGQAIEVKLKRMGLLNDQRQKFNRI